ncbi:MAG TPA: hypothetical protein VGP63_08290 [Planctomycetaceae bacterium]|nr:hypothetical protein [Planctomycetaceae bacterium]
MNDPTKSTNKNPTVRGRTNFCTPAGKTQFFCTSVDFEKFADQLDQDDQLKIDNPNWAKGMISRWTKPSCVQLRFFFWNNGVNGIADGSVGAPLGDPVYIYRTACPKNPPDLCHLVDDSQFCKSNTLTIVFKKGQPPSPNCLAGAIEKTLMSRLKVENRDRNMVIQFGLGFGKQKLPPDDNNVTLIDGGRLILDFTTLKNVEAPCPQNSTQPKSAPAGSKKP